MGVSFSLEFLFYLFIYFTLYYVLVLILCLWFYSDDEDLHQGNSVELDTGFGNIIIVDNLPVVPREKFEKLEGVIRKIYSQIGLIKDNGLWMPIDPETNKTSGYCFIEFNTPLVILSLPVSSHWLYIAKTDSSFV